MNGLREHFRRKEITESNKHILRMLYKHLKWLLVLTLKQQYYMCGIFILHWNVCGSRFLEYTEEHLKYVVYEEKPHKHEHHSLTNFLYKGKRPA